MGVGVGVGGRGPTQGKQNLPGPMRADGCLGAGCEPDPELLVSSATWIPLVGSGASVSMCVKWG